MYELSYNTALAQILAGVAILLFGMLQLGAGFKSFSGGALERILKKSTDTRLKSISFGAITTMIMQSSSLVCVITISFLSANLITLAQGIGVIFGANLGNSAGSWLIVGLNSISISKLALPLIVVGTILSFQKATFFKGIGGIFNGVGFFFLGVDYIKTGFDGYKEIMDFSRFSIDGFRGVLLFVGLGAVITGVVQSSHATLAIIIVALTHGQISYENAMAATLGTSVGGVVTAVVASLGSNIDGKRVAIANCIFNFTIAIVVIAAFPFFVHAVDAIAKVLGIANVGLKVALFHTLFNLVGVIFISIFIVQIVGILEKLLKEPKDKNIDKPLYLNEQIIEFTETAIEAIQQEVEHLYENAFAIISHTIGFNRRDIRSNLSFDEIIKKPWFSGEVDLDLLYKRKIKVLFDAILDYSLKVQNNITNNNEEYIERITKLRVASRDIVEATKGLKLIQQNIKQYSKSQNQYLSTEYNTIRKDLGQFLRSVEELKNMPDDKLVLILAQFDKAKDILKARDNEEVEHVEELLRQQKVTIANGTSILNDAAFVIQIVEKIVEAIEIIYDYRVKKYLQSQKAKEAEGEAAKS